ncbi:MAG: histidine phosphatase family protein [Tissierellia bacterium]|nr:histidine phosphatase family protein [Tissierellia bacterium]
MKRIFFVRHGESQWNVVNRMQGQNDIPLTEKGIKQANSIANRLVNENIDKIYSSDLKRAYETALIIGDRLNLDVTKMKEFREMNFGVWEGKTHDEIMAEYQEQFLYWKKEPENTRIDGAETLQELQERSMAALNEIISSNKEDSILVVSHGVTIKVMILGLLGMSLSNYKNLVIENVSLSIVELRDYNRVLKILNDTCHVKEIC